MNHEPGKEPRRKISDLAKSALDGLIEDGIKWLLGAVALVILALGSAVFGVRLDFISLPEWVPFQPDRTPMSELSVNDMDGLAGYTFITGVFSDVEQALDGSGGLHFKPAETEMIRVCRNFKIPQSDNAAELLEALEEKVAPCLSVTPVNLEAGGVRYEISPTQSDDVTRVNRANRGGTEIVPQFFCSCDARVVEKFLSDGNGSTWP